MSSSVVWLALKTQQTSEKHFYFLRHFFQTFWEEKLKKHLKLSSDPYLSLLRIPQKRSFFFCSQWAGFWYDFIYRTLSYILGHLYPSHTIYWKILIWILGNLDIPREKSLTYLQTVETYLQTVETLTRLHSAASDLGLCCLQITLLGISRLQWN